MNSSTLCWDCQNAVPDACGKRGCNWSRCQKPVEGWDAILTFHMGNIAPYASYEVVSCPEFVPDEGFKSLTFKELLQLTPKGQKRICVYRMKLGMTQRKLADTLGIKRDKMYRLENGYQAGTEEELNAIAKMLGVDKDEFIPEENING